MRGRNSASMVAGLQRSSLSSQEDHDQNGDVVADDDVLRLKLARYSYHHNAEHRARLSSDARVAHEAVLAAIGTPESSPREAGSPSTGAQTEGSRASDDSSDDGSTASSSSSSSDDDEEDADENSNDASSPESTALDDILGADRRERMGVMTMAEQVDESPLRQLNRLLGPKSAGGSGAVDVGGLALGEETPVSAVLHRLLGQSSSGGHDDPLSITRTRSGETEGAPSSLKGKRDPVRLSTSESNTSNVTEAPNSGSERRRSSLTMIQQLQSQQTMASSSLNGAITVAGMLAMGSPRHELSFKKGKEIGKGGFGVVFQAVLEDGRLAAVKQLPATDRKGIDKEMRVMCSLPPHPHCVQYLGAKRTRHHVYMVMEYVSGGSIHGLRQMVGRLPEAVARRYVHMTLLGLHHLQTHHIIHQDIKGANVLLDERGCAKIADFGCIKDLSYHNSNRSDGGATTQGGAGTPLWMAPEVCRGEHPSMKSDVWSFGCFFLEMVNETGLPWNFKAGTSLQGAGYAIGSATTPPPFPNTLSSVAKDFLSQCLAIHPAQRSSVEQLLQHRFFLSNHVDHMPREVDFYKTVQSLASEGTLTERLTATQESFRLDAASDDDDDATLPPYPFLPPAQLRAELPLRQGMDTARRVVDHGNVVWRSAGVMKVDLQKQRSQQGPL